MKVTIERSNGFHRIIETIEVKANNIDMAIREAKKYCQSILNQLITAECLQEGDE